MDDSELEDIESQLYSQIYHPTNAETEENITNPTENIQTPRIMKNSTRYFNPWSPGSKFQKLPNSPRPPSIRTNLEKTKDFYSKNYGNSRKPDISINQLVVLSPKSPIICTSAKELRKARWKARWKEKMMEKRLRKRARKLARKLAKESKPVEKEKESKPVEKEPVITLSDSEEDSCVLVDDKLPVESLKMEEPSETLLDDVIFVEPVSVPVEVINLDEESASSPPSHSFVSPKPSQVHQERKELLSTPDSASNDFMNNSGVELNQRNFNFSLHGSDFNAGEFTKPAKPAETCETESSSSTTDVNSVNLMKTIVFNEVEFPRDDIFAEGNLEHFGKLITPSRTCSRTPVAQSSLSKPSSAQNQNVYSSESSESDFEEIDNQKNKALPELSHFHVSPDKKKQPKNKNKKKKKDVEAVEDPQRKKRRSEGTEGSDESLETPSRKKSKNRKKKEVEVVESESIVEDVGKGKSKKKRSDAESEDQSETIPDPPSTKTRKKRRSEVSEVQTPETVEVEARSSEPIDNPLPENAPKPINVQQCITIEPDSPSLEGLIVVDETFGESQFISDSESVLSALNEEHNIQINIDTQPSQNPESGSTTDLQDFSVRELQLAMSNDPKLWDISENDRTPPGKNGRSRRCTKCREMGHSAFRCPNRVYPKCRLCGEGGHYEPRCPNKLCTQCGQRSNYLTNYCGSCFRFRNIQCHLCLMTGHIAEKCPDLWRRYHLTTSEGPLNTYDGPALKKPEELWCSGCAQNGHLEHECDFYKPLYPPSDPYIKSYDDIYESPGEGDWGRGANRWQGMDEQPRFHYTNTVNPNVLDQQRHMNNFVNTGFNPNYYCQMNNNQFQNANFDFAYMNNQQGFFIGDPNDIYVPNAPAPAACFENALPTFIALNPNVPMNAGYTESPKIDYSGDSHFKRTANFMKRCNSTFFSSNTATLQHFLTEELQKLSKLAVVSDKMVREYRKRQIPRRVKDKDEYYQTLNMLLFGIFNLVDGKMHLNRLKQFKIGKVKTKVTNAFRHMLFRSYLYIFGWTPHDRVDYTDLLRKV